MSIIKYIVDNAPKPEDDKILRDGIVTYNSQIIRDKASHFSIFAKNADKIIGGVLIWPR